MSLSTCELPGCRHPSCRRRVLNADADADAVVGAFEQEVSLDLRPHPTVADQPDGVGVTDADASGRTRSARGQRIVRHSVAGLLTTGPAAGACLIWRKTVTVGNIV